MNDICIKVFHYMPKKRIIDGSVLLCGVLGYAIGKLLDKNIKLQKKIDILEKEIKKYKEEE